jgi:polar amino acid transport system permease protein
MRAGNIAASRDVTLIPYLLVGVIYLILIALATLIQRRIEKKMNFYR